ncbi:MAG: hypothetical protein ACLUHE_05220 [Christensenellales bacterium]
MGLVTATRLRFSARAQCFLMIGAGVYELTAANGEKKPIKDLLKE